MLQRACVAPAVARRVLQYHKPGLHNSSSSSYRLNPCRRAVVANYWSVRPSGDGVSSLAAQMKPFVGCNCYYLVRYAAQKRWDELEKTLQFIKDCGFTVIRTWAFTDGPLNDSLQRTPGVPDCDGLAALDWLVNRLEAPDMQGIQLMPTLTNCVPTRDYGGLWQYVLWARGESGPAPYRTGPNADRETFDILDRYEFYTNDLAKHYYENYVRAIVGRYKDRRSIHSWDICNEPRNKAVAAQGDEIYKWVNHIAGVIKGIDPNHMVTIGSEGYFGPRQDGAGLGVSGSDRQGSNPFGNSFSNGCNWLLEGTVPDIDFACIHTWADQWTESRDQDGWKKENLRWLDIHIKTCQRELRGKPLVLQEFNMPAGQQRLDYIGNVKAKLLENNPLVGVMFWMVAHEGYPKGGNQDGYTIYPSSSQFSEERSKLQELCRAGRDLAEGRVHVPTVVEA